MKKCPYCAEEIQDEAIVCKHCGRDLKAGASQVQIIEAKKKTSPAAWGCLTIIVLLVVASIAGQCGRDNALPSSTTSTSPQPAANTPTTAVAPPNAPAPSPIGKWLRAESQSKMDDSKTVSYQLEAENEIQGWLERRKLTLIARGQEGKIEAYMITGMSSSVETGLNDEHTVQVRFDEGKALRQSWSDSTDDKALFAPSARSFLQSVSSAKRLRFGFTPFNASPQIAEFDVAGFGQPYKDILATCSKKK